MGIEVRGPESFRAKVYQGRKLIIQATFPTRAEAEHFLKIEKAKLTLDQGQHKRDVAWFNAHAQFAPLPVSVQRLSQSEAAGHGGPFPLLPVELFRGNDIPRDTMLVFESPAQARARREASQTLREIAEKYKKEVTPKKKGKLQEDRRLKLFLLHPIAKRLATSVSKDDFQAYQDERLKRVSASTSVREIGLWHTIIEHARNRWGLVIATNPASLPRPGGADIERDRRLEPGEEAILLGIEDELLRDAILIAIDTTLARGEIVKLKSVHLKRMGTAQAYIELPKGFSKNRRDRRIPLSERAHDVLARRAETNPDQLFPFVTADALTTRFCKLIRKLKINDLTFHDLRHEATSRFCETKLYNQAELMQMTGHYSVKTFMRYLKSDGAELTDRLRSRQ